jgi:S-DNA-T family DNA segregation ATPase FtsK/SpoIIIE
MAARKKKVQAAPMAEQLFKRFYPYRREVLGGLLLLFTIITLLSLFSLTGGSLSNWWANLFSQLFGWWAIPAAVLLGGFGALLVIGRLRDEEYSVPPDIVIGLELIFVVGLSLTHLLAIEPGEYAVRLARSGGGGGFVGWGISNILIDLVGEGIAVFFLAMIGLTAVGMAFRLTSANLVHVFGRVGDWAKLQLEKPRLNNGAQLDVTAPEAAPNVAKKRQKSKVPEQKVQQLSPPTMSAEAALAAMPKTRRRLPPLDILSPAAEDPYQGANARYQSQIIEETLRGFGIPAEVVEINSGPTVTQFGLKLGTTERKLPDGTLTQQRVRVSKVVALNNDLALALAAAPIRIEAPVPGRPLVGIEVPNVDKSMVSLRGVIEAASFKKKKKPLRVALGKNVSGQAVSASLAEMPHLLIAGATGSGKSVCINAIISTLLFTHGPEQLRFLMIDPKMVELTNYNGIPHLVAPVVTEFDQVVGALAWTTREMERRYKLFASVGARSIASYNQKVGAKGERLSFLVLVIDELADLMMMAPDEVERHVCRIAQMARATGIHLVIATQRPSVDVVTGLIKANFPTRIAFAVTSQIDSRVILDSPGAERLLGRGDMLYMAADSPKLMRLQGCFVSDPEMRNIVNYWRSSQGSPTRAEPPAEGQPEQAELPWADIMAAADKDDLLEEAVKLVVEAGRASTSLLQRRLGIGYPRASRLMDQLEEEGVIGPSEGSRPREVFWKEEPAEDEYDEFERDVAGAAPPDA